MKVQRGHRGEVNVSSVQEKQSKKKILGHQFNNRFEAFAPCYSQSFLLADLKKNIASRKRAAIHV
jgi:hypothetical protein